MPQLNRFLPSFHFHEIHSIFIPGPAQLAYLSTKSLCPQDMSLLVKLMSDLRSLPDRLTGNASNPFSPSEPFLNQLTSTDFVLLLDSPSEIVFGIVGQFWKLRPLMAPISSPSEFLAFDRPDFAKVACNLLFEPCDGGTIVRTETRIFTPEPQARRRFAWYWLLIRLGSGLIRRLWLRAIRRKALAQLPLVSLPSNLSMQR